MSILNYLTMPQMKNVCCLQGSSICLSEFVFWLLVENIAIFQMQYGHKHILSVLLCDSAETEIAMLIKRVDFNPL